MPSNWVSHAQRSSKAPCFLVEVDLDWYADNSIQPVNDDGSLCYRTPSTTKQVGEFELGIRTRRFSSSEQAPLAGSGAIPCVDRVIFAPEELKIGEAFGSFGQVVITLRDFTPESDYPEDPFIDDASRGEVKGSYFTRLLARNPYWTNRQIRIIEGWVSDGKWFSDETIVHHYTVRGIQGPSNGTLKIVAVGPLQVLNLAEAELPTASRGTLLLDIDDTIDEISIRGDVSIYEEYPDDGGLVRIDDELIRYTSREDEKLLGCLRAQFGTEATEHSIRGTIQLCIEYSSQIITDIIKDLLLRVEVPEEFIDLDGWETEGSTWLARYIHSQVLSEPTPVMDYLRELLEVSLALLWWDDIEAKIRLRAIRPANRALVRLNEEYNLLDTPSLDTDMSARVSRCDVLIGLRTPVDDEEKQASYRVRVIGRSQGNTETEHRGPSLVSFLSRWLSEGQAGIASRTTYQLTAYLRDGRKTIDFDVASKDAFLKIGDLIELQIRDSVDTEGNPIPQLGLLTRKQTIEQGSVYRYRIELTPSLVSRFAYIMPNDAPEYDDASASQRDPGGFISNVNNIGLDNDPPYVLG